MSDDYGTTYEERAQIAEAELARLRPVLEDAMARAMVAEGEVARLRAELADAKTLLALFVEHWTTEYTSYLKQLERLEELVNRARDLLAQEPPA